MQSGFPSFFSKVSQLSGRGAVADHRKIFSEAEAGYRLWSSVQGIQVQWVQGQLTPDEALAALMAQGRDEATAHKILRSWGQPLATSSPSADQRAWAGTVRSQFVKGKIDRDKAVSILERMCGLSNGEAVSKVDSWHRVPSSEPRPPEWDSPSPAARGPTQFDLFNSALLSKGWSRDAKQLMGDLRRRYYAGEVDRQIAMEALQYMGGLSESTAGQVINKWEDLAPGFEGMAEGFEGLGEQPVVLRPNQKHREKKRAREAQLAREAETAARDEAAQGNLFSGTPAEAWWQGRYNSPANSQHVYHGSRHPITSFEMDYLAGNGTTHGLILGYGMYFTFRKSVAEEYAGEGGYVYELEVRAHRDDLLRWGDSFSGQSPKVQRALSPMMGELGLGLDATGAEIYNGVCDAFAGGGASDKVHAMRRASEKLLALGIPGSINRSGISICIWAPGLVMNVSPVVAPGEQGLLFASASPSRYGIACHFASPLVRPLIASRLSGKIDDTLMAAYLSGLGEGAPDPNLESVGPKGAVTLTFDIGAGGHRTAVDLGGNLETGYVVNSIADDLGIFPEGTEDGDFLEASVVQNILRRQGQQDSPGSAGGWVTSSANPSQGFAAVSAAPPAPGNLPSEQAAMGSAGAPINAVKRYSGATPSINDLASLVNCVQGDIHLIHLYASGSGQPGWDELHNMAGEYYEQLGKDYDDLCELSLQRGEDITHPNLSARAIGYTSLFRDRGGGFAYGEALVNFHALVMEILDYANDLKWFWADSGAASSTALVAYLDDFIMRWSKEAEYKLARRLHRPGTTALIAVTGSDNVLPVEVPSLPFGEVLVGALPTGEGSAVKAVALSPVTSSFAAEWAYSGKVPVVSSGILKASDAIVPREFTGVVVAVRDNVIPYVNEQLIPELVLEKVARWPKRPSYVLCEFSVPSALLFPDSRIYVGVEVSPEGVMGEGKVVCYKVNPGGGLCWSLRSWGDVVLSVNDCGDDLRRLGNEYG